MKQGALFFDETADRYDIRFDLADYYGCPRRGLERLTGADLSGAAQAADAHFLRQKAAQHITPRKEDGKCKMKSTKKSLPYP